MLVDSLFSCAVDCFLEVSYVILYSHLKNTTRSEFFDLVYDSASFYDAMLSFRDNDNIIIGNDDRLEHSLATIRQPVWDFLA